MVHSGQHEGLGDREQGFGYVLVQYCSLLLFPRHQVVVGTFSLTGATRTELLI